jgi:hypothetical protein
MILKPRHVRGFFHFSRSVARFVLWENFAASRAPCSLRSSRQSPDGIARENPGNDHNAAQHDNE